MMHEKQLNESHSPKGPFAESVRDDFNDERLEYVEDICEEVYVCVELTSLLLIPLVSYDRNPSLIMLIRFQQTRIDPNSPSEEYTTAAIIMKSWINVICLGFRV
jgi:hypothetical protein